MAHELVACQMVVETAGIESIQVVMEIKDKTDVFCRYFVISLLIFTIKIWFSEY